MSEKPEPPDFELTKYGYDREHELELNKFTHALEVEQLKLLVLLNGGAAAALLTFAERSTYPLTRGGLLAPVMLWIFGLGLAAAATVVMRRAQARYSQAYRYRRNAVEWRRFETSTAANGRNPIALPEHDLFKKLKKWLKKDGESFAAAYEGLRGDIVLDMSADAVRNRGEWWAKWISPLSIASVLLFLAGAVTAALVATAGD